MKKLVFLRHGESQWNLENRFTGWVDVDLSKKGIQEAQQAGVLLNQNKFIFEFAHTSVLKRAIRTLWLCLEQLDMMWLPVRQDWRLNERHYGALQGLNKSETAQKYGPDQVHLWRRSFNVRPPELEDKSWHAQNDIRYQRLSVNLPRCESLQDTLFRCQAYWSQHIYPQLKEKDQILVVAHGNTIRAMVKFLDQIDDQSIAELNIPTGQPLVYEFDLNLRVCDRYYIANPEKTLV